MTTQQPFNPTEHLINVPRRQRQPDGTWQQVDNQYLETRWRLVWLHDKYPDGASIVTELLEHQRGEYAVFRAQVSVDGRTATGWALKQAGGPISYLENAETHALGRALAALGLGTQFCDDFAEGADAEGQLTPVDAPAPRPKAVPVSPVVSGPPSPTRTPSSSPRPSGSSSAPTTGGAPAGGWQDRPATDPQIKAIYAIARGTQAMDDGTLAEWCTRRFGAPPEQLSRRQASEAIDALKLGTAS